MTRGGRPRVLWLIKGLGIGGAERLVVESADAWNHDAYDFEVAYVLPWKDQLVGELARRDVPVTCLGTRSTNPLSVGRRLRSLVAAHQVDLVHAHLPATGIIARLASPVPVIYTEHNMAHSYRLPTRLLNRATYRRNAAVGAVSEAVAGTLAGYPVSRLAVIPNGISVGSGLSPEQRAAIRSELGIGEDVRLIVHVGNIRPHKGHDNLIAAVERLAGHRTDFRVVSFGGEKNDGDLARVRDAAAQAGVAGVIRFAGRVPDARPYLEAADLVVNPSDHEGLPLVVLEAMGAGTPVVATDVGGVGSVVQQGVTGTLVPPRSPDQLAKAMDAILGDPDLARRLGSAGQDLIRRSHGIAAMMESYMALYEEALRAR